MKIEKTEINCKIRCYNDYFSAVSPGYVAARCMGIVLFLTTGRETDNDYLGLVFTALYLNELSGRFDGDKYAALVHKQSCNCSRINRFISCYINDGSICNCENTLQRQ